VSILDFNILHFSNIPLSTSPIFLCRPTAFFRLAGVVGCQRALHTENSGFAYATLPWHISTFRGYRILFSIRNPNINPSPIIFLFIHNHLTQQKVVLHSIIGRFCLRPSFRHVVFHFRTYKRDLAILMMTATHCMMGVP
jgi:hypothetical protein